MTLSEPDPVATLLADRNRLGRVAKHFHIWMTGVPDPGNALQLTTPLRLLGKDLVLLVFAMSLAAAGVLLSGLGSAGLLVGMAMSIAGVLAATGRLRRLVVGHVHEASHDIVTAFYVRRGMAVARAKRVTEVILDVGTALSFTTNGQDYRRDHGRHHDFDWLGTLGDPDGRLLHAWRLWPDRTGNVRKQLLRLAFNPVWHLRFFGARMRSNLLRGNVHRRLLGGASLALWAATALLLPWQIWLVAVFLPLVPGYQIATLLQLVTIHPYGFHGPATSLTAYAERTWERIPYAPMPATGASLLEWANWSVRMVGHSAARLAVLDDTMIAHGYHHLAWPIGRPFEDWWNTAQHWVDAYCAGLLPDGAATRVLWGLPAAIVRQQTQFNSARR